MRLRVACFARQFLIVVVQRTNPVPTGSYKLHTIFNNPCTQTWRQLSWNFAGRETVVVFGTWTLQAPYFVVCTLPKFSFGIMSWEDGTADLKGWMCRSKIPSPRSNISMFDLFYLALPLPLLPFLSLIFLALNVYVVTHFALWISPRPAAIYIRPLILFLRIITTVGTNVVGVLTYAHRQSTIYLIYIWEITNMPHHICIYYQNAIQLLKYYSDATHTTASMYCT